MKRQTVKCEEVFVNLISDKELISQICKDSCNLIEKSKQSNLKMIAIFKWLPSPGAAISDFRGWREILPFVTPWMDVEGIMLSEISQRQNAAFTYVESKKKMVKLMERVEILTVTEVQILVIMTIVFFKLFYFIEVCVCLCVSHSVMSDSAIPWTVAHQTPLSVEFSRQGYWNGLPFPSPGNLSNPGIKPRSPVLQTDFFLPSELPGKPLVRYNWHIKL